MNKPVAVSIFLFLSVAVLFNAGCPSLPTNEPEPISDFETYVNKTVYHWLKVRVDNASGPILASPTAEWRDTATIRELVDWFSLHLSPPTLWNFQRLVDEIKRSEWYDDPAMAPLDSELLNLLKSSLASFDYDLE